MNMFSPNTWTGSIAASLAAGILVSVLLYVISMARGRPRSQVLDAALAGVVAVVLVFAASVALHHLSTKNEAGVRSGSPLVDSEHVEVAEETPAPQRTSDPHEDTEDATSQAQAGQPAEGALCGLLEPAPGGVGMVQVPAGKFLTLGPKGELEEVYVADFYIDLCEVTNRQYLEFCNAKGHAPPADPGFPGMPGYLTNYPDYPVVDVSWRDANAYCQWAGKRLPTAVEWEKAARGTDGRIYPWGNVDPDVDGIHRANIGLGSTETHKEVSTKDGFAYTSPVGYYPDGRSPYGCYDMAGNVGELCADPAGTGSYGTYRVWLGGSFIRNAEFARCDSRWRCVETMGFTNVGFRCAR
jgi:iron(II)-dependent oxidoreductase